ncbi:amino acid ABC transporter substrate-binding protein [Nocardioides cavernaquae]|uniref:Amino acid ABC transporter substrate-binding protein n=1 Tax=Nocardioides cavernaquae TaxID=2321396 RepID=A0A3A5H3A1_9ACTN|nr:amino acid ABC transporter substrate-binding protein [Nocardioides cavernaquae]
MNTIISKASILCVASAVMLSLSACGGSGASTTVSSDCTPKHSDISTVKTGTLTVGVIDYPPFSSYNDGKPDGIDISIVKKIAADDCLEVSWQPATYADAITSIAQGNLDIATGSIAVTEDRMKAVDFSSSLYVEAMGITTKAGAKTIEEVRDMDGKVGTVDGYMTNADLEKIFGDRLISYPSPVELKADFDAGRLIADFETYAVAALQFKGNSDVTVVPATGDVGEDFGSLNNPAEDGFPLTKGNASLKTAISDGIKAQQADGSLGKLLEAVGLSADLAKVSSEQYVVPAS